jgi:hypothetical protein
MTSTSSSYHPAQLIRFSIHCHLILILLVGCTTKSDESQSGMVFTVETGSEKLLLRTSDSVLAARFEWAARQALAYAHDGKDPVGKWYEAALPNREAFCMRDVAHQSIGAHLLGLQEHNMNMLRKFAMNISDSKDWCTYWEINRYDQPAPVDYRNDNEFWYNLPANFDILNSCYLLYQWTADPGYIEDSLFLNFYLRTVYDYVERWDLDVSKIMTRNRFMNLDLPIDSGDSFHICRGLPSYGEGEPAKLYLGGDQLALQYSGYRAYACIQQIRGNDAESDKFFQKAKELKTFYNEEWWDPERHRYYTSLHTDGRFGSGPSRYLLTTRIGQIEGRFEQTLKDLVEIEDINIESLSYFPQMFYEYDQNEVAYEIIMDLSSPDEERREYPEVSYSVVEAMVRGMAGLEADAATKTVNTMPRLGRETNWIEFSNIPLFENKITLRHDGNYSTVLENQEGVDLKWKAIFPGIFDVLIVDGQSVPAKQGVTLSGLGTSCVDVVLKAGQSIRITTPENER